MGINSSKSTSRRGYLSQDELEQYSNISITDTAEADDVIGQAEEIIDSWVGYQIKFLQAEITGRCSQAGGSLTFYLDTDQLNIWQKDYLKGCEVEIIGGTGEGQRRRITTSAYDGTITIANAWDTVPDTTSFFKIYQLGKFPRPRDVRYYTESTPYQYFKSIPEAVKRAVAAQVQYMDEMGDAFFAGDSTQKQSERIGDYSYELGQGSQGIARLVAPKAKVLLRGIINRTGVIV